MTKNKICERSVREKLKAMLSLYNIRYKEEVGVAPNARIDIYLLDADIGIEVKGIPIKSYGESVEHQLGKYTRALNEVWLVCANYASKKKANYRVDKVICVDEFPTCIPYIKDKIDNY